MGYFYVCHASSCSSSWTRLFAKPTIYQESTFEVRGTIFWTTEKLIKYQVGVTGLSKIDRKQPTWRESSLLCDRAVHFMKSQTYVFAYSVLRLGGVSSVPVQAWKDKIKWYLETRCLKDLDRIDGEPMEFEWKNVPRIHYVENSRRDSKDDGGIKV